MTEKSKIVFPHIESQHALAGNVAPPASAFSTQAAAKLALFQYIEGWYNPRRLHSALGYKSPLTYERRRVPVLEQIG